MLSDDRLGQRYAELLAPYVGETAGHYVHRVNGGYAARPSCSRGPSFCWYELLAGWLRTMARRRFTRWRRADQVNNILWLPETAQAKANQEISASSLQSLDDLEATIV